MIYIKFNCSKRIPFYFSPHRDQIQFLTDEINKLRSELRQQGKKQQTPNVPLEQVGQFPEPVVTTAGTESQTPKQQQYAYVYGYPMATNPTNVGIAQTRGPPNNYQPNPHAPIPQELYQKGFTLNHQPMMTTTGDPNTLRPGMSVGPVVHPEYYGHPVPPVAELRATNEVPSVERWEAYDHGPEDYTDSRRNDYFDRERPRRSHARDQRTSRDRGKDKLAKMRNYYMPNKAGGDMNNNKLYGSRNSGYPTSSYVRTCDHCNGGTNYVSGPMHSVQGTVIGEVPPPPSYQQVRREVCKWCHGTGKCDHPVMVQNTGQLQQTVPGGSPYVMVPAASASPYVLTTPAHPQER